jgi:hypothetical protein
MASATVKIDAATYAKLKQSAAELGKPMIEVMADAVEAYRRQSFLEALNADFARLRASPEAWEEERAEREAWDTTLRDDLADDGP